MRTKVLVGFALLACLLEVSAEGQFCAAPALTGAALNVIPQPKEVRLEDAVFHITPATRIVLAAPYAQEDRVAAESLGAEIEERTRHRAAIVTRRQFETQAHAIWLVRLGWSSVSKVLKDHGLNTASMGPQGYLLAADTKRVIIAAPSAQGIFYGAQTLRQLLLPDPDTGLTQSSAISRSHQRLRCPAVAIRDWPSMQWRGVHDDLSRGPIPTLEYMKKQIRTLAEYKINLFALYIEHVFDYQQNPLIVPKEAALTSAEVKTLVAYATKYYVTLLPEQQAFGHLHHVLKYETYSDLAERPHGHVLSPANPKSYDLVRSMYSELAPLFPGAFFHIGADETFELGQGQSRQLAQSRGLGEVYLEHIRRVYEILQPYHKRLMFWGDIAVKYPSLLNLLPRDMIAVPWEYGARSSYDDLIAPFKNAGLEVFVAPGASNWNAIWPNFEVAFVDIRNFIRDGQKYSALGTLNTTWDDDGESLFEMTWPALVFGAAASWQPGESSIENFLASYDWAFYRAADHVFRDVILRLNTAHVLLKKAGVGEANDQAFWLNPFTLAGAEYVARALPVAHDLRMNAEQALESLYRNRAAARMHPETIDVLLLAAMRLDLLGMKIQLIREISDFYQDAYTNVSNVGRVENDLEEITSINGRLEDLRDATTRLRKYYAAAWGRENRPYYLPNVLVRYDNLASLFQTKIEQVQQARRQYAERKTLPTPEEMGFLAAGRPIGTASAPKGVQ